MNPGLRGAMVGLAGFCAYLNLYAPQSLLPLLAQEFAVGPSEISITLTATTIAIAMTAPFAGAIADVLGRKRVITAAVLLTAIPTLMFGLAPNLSTLVFWRLMLGIVLPPIFTVAVAYIGEEWSAAEATTVTGRYMSAGSIGGFSGRFIAGVLADTIGWRGAFIAIAALTVACGIAVAAILPPERQFVRSEDLAASGRQMLRHLANPQLLATFAVGFGVLFTFMSLFTWVNFLLAAPPYSLSAAFLGSIFVVYLAGSAVSLMTGRLVTRFGRRRAVVGVLGIAICGALLTLIPSLPLIITGLAVVAGCGFLCQAASTSYVALVAQTGRTAALGLYTTSYYVGGSIGAVLPGIAWSAGGWPACIAMAIAMLVIMAAIVWLAWTPSGEYRTDRPIEEDHPL